VRTQEHVYIEFEGRRGREIYDLREDPRQTHNLIGTEEGRSVAGALRAMFEDLQEE
jgi:hypothetical protein